MIYSHGSFVQNILIVISLMNAKELFDTKITGFIRIREAYMGLPQNRIEKFRHTSTPCQCTLYMDLIYSWLCAKIAGPLFAILVFSVQLYSWLALFFQQNKLS